MYVNTGVEKKKRIYPVQMIYALITGMLLEGD